MTANVEELLALIDLEPIEHDIFRSRFTRDIGTGRVFGGQALAQALTAAQRTVDEDRIAHSLHGYFILPGDLTIPIVYFVERLRDGKSFTTRRVTAIQRGRAIFNMSASFHLREEGPEHQAPPPAAPAPDGLVSELDAIRKIAAHIPEGVRDLVAQDRPIDIRLVDPPDLLDPAPSSPDRRSWFRAIGEMPDDIRVHQAILAYASDHNLLGTALQPHAVTIRSPRIQVASLDHSLWFHRPFRVNEWLLYATDSPVAFGARGFTRGNIYTQDGTLVASCAQEGLMRPVQPRPERS